MSASVSPVTSPPVGGIRAAAHIPVGEVSQDDVRLLLRFGPMFLVVALAMAVQLWARMEVRQAAVALDAARSEVAQAEIERDRLLLERTTLRAPGRIRAAASEMALTAPVAIVDIAADQAP